MVQPGAKGWGEERQGLDRVLTCRCWDCAAYRSHLLRKVALLAILLGLSGGWAFNVGAWSGAAPSHGDVAAEPANMAWL